MVLLDADLPTVDTRVKKVASTVLPTPSEAVSFYRDAGGSITDQHGFAIDPLIGNKAKQQLRQDAFVEQFSFEHIFMHWLIKMMVR